MNKKLLNIAIPLLILIILFIALNWILSDEQKQKVDDIKLVGKTSENSQNEPKKSIVEWVDEVAEHEKCGLGIIDTNGLESYGILCFQEQTFRAYVNRYDLLPEVEEAEIMNWITDGEFQRELAYKMIDEDVNNWRHWYTTTKIKGVGIPVL